MHHLTLAVLALQSLKLGTLSRYLSVLVLILSIGTSRPTVASRPSNLPNPFLLAPQIQPLLAIAHVYKLYLLTCLTRPSVL